ncbi:bacillithiol system redox-active protein YtxJ [Aquibacillus koreensis]|uniref:Bacillithiol system redox-active protein YtxJ n=1 Tax=Aquibacillus koreensis TaxID=279446 RepID=A0A9X3WGG4_9BACI|nr:bacillithiol system redox-active protein YtxJ [Aquibacillus koreensis]MCT2535013.1 bacillithiol system redox-active protein YtxJ [Aquibacillus koreensis]MDC3419300.1 bacillithiol system redox-active protein YtxJ [Aquibacillus koreensis]
MTIKVIENEMQFEDIKNDTKAFMLLKHSLTCPISAAAEAEYRSFQEEANLPLYILHVQEARELSNTIADTFKVKHESPQVLLFNNDQVVWHESHQRIKQDILASHAEKL